MKIEHLAIWVDDLEAMKGFYTKYFGATANTKYINPLKQFSSYFLSFEDRTARIELMQKSNVTANNESRGNIKGLAHFAFSVGSKNNVEALTERLHTDGFTIYDMPRTTGDGYYESIVLDPEGNFIEITI